jgi:RNA polymerase sigma-70 factor (ECF subfamily)
MAVPDASKTTSESRRDAFARMARDCESSLLRTALRLCLGNRDRAEDLVQDALLRGFTAYLEGRFREGGSGRAWLTRILINAYLNDYARRTKWEAGITVDELTFDGEAGPESTHAALSDVPGATLMRDTLDEPLETALRALPHVFRLCVLLVDVEGMEYAEAAAALGVPVGTVRSRLARARFKLQETLAEYARERRIIS